MLIKSIQGIIIPALAFLLLGCGPPAVLLVGGVKVEPPSDQGTNPEIISVPLPAAAAIDSIKLDLIRMGFTIKDADRRLGIIQTDDKILAYDEYFENRYSPEQQAAGGCLAAAAVVGCIAGVVALNSGDHDNDNHPKNRRCDDAHDHHHDNYSSEEPKPDIVQNKGRLQILSSRSSDSAQTTVEVTAFLSTYTNGVKGSEVQAIRLHPFVQKYACLLTHKNCGRAPGQKVIPRDTSVYHMIDSSGADRH